MTCSFCGLEFSEDEVKRGCSGCPLSRSCGKIKCPRCGFEVAKEPSLLKLLRKWRA